MVSHAHQSPDQQRNGNLLGRRAFVRAAAVAAGGAALVPFAINGSAQEDRDYGPDASPVHYPDQDVVAVTPAFNKYIIGNAAIERLWTGGLWLEGPAWHAMGQYLVFCDIPNDIQLRWLEDDGHVSTFRDPAGYAGGNTYDFEGRQLTTQHGERQVIRYEHDGSVTVLADTYDGKPFNAPNDLVVHPNGSVWFTDPPYGTSAPGGYEGHFGELYQPNAVYRIDPDGAVERVTDELQAPNGLCFSPDYRQLYIVDTGADEGDIKVFDVLDESRLGSTRQFTDMVIDGTHVGPDSVKADTDGNIWAVGGWTGYPFDGVHCFTPEGERIGEIRLPETTSNVTFGGPNRNRLMMTASQSLYALYTNAIGAHIA